MATGPLTLHEILAIPGIADMLLAGRPAWLWAADEGRILFANAAGVAFFREDRLSALTRRSFDMSRPGLAQLARADTALPRDGAARLIMLRLVVGLREVAMPCRCRLIEREAGSSLVLAQATGGAVDKSAPEERLSILFDDAETAVEVMREDEAIYRNCAAGDKNGDAEKTILDIDWQGERLRLMVSGPAERRADTACGGKVMPDTEDVGPAPVMTAEPTEPGVEPRRFSFELDTEGRFVEVGPALAATVGERHADLVGRLWTEVAQKLALDPGGSVAEALDRRQSWGEIVLDWPTDGGETAKVHLSAQPRLGDADCFAGYRGYGDVVAQTAAPDEPVSDDVPPEELEDEEVLPASEVDADEPVTAGDEPEPLGERLNEQERSAFEAIATALGARLPGEEEDQEPETARDPQTEAGSAGGADEDDRLVRFPGAPDRVVTAILDRLPIGIAVFRDETILYANGAFLDLFGYTDTDDLEIAGGLGALFDGQRGADDGTVSARRRDGAPVAIESRLGRLQWLDGAAMFVTARQADGHAHAAAEARDEEIAELRAILDTATDGVLVLGPGGRIEALNRSAEALLGRDADEIRGRSVEVLLAEESRAAVRDYLARLAAGGVESVLNDGCAVVALARGGEVPLFLTMGRIGDADPPRFCAVMRDLTEWKAAEAELVSARRRAEEASAQKSDFLAKISHEIRTPLNAIIGFAEVMLEGRFGPIGNERYQDYLKDIRASGEHVMSLVNDLLDLSKVEAGRLELNFSPVSLNDLVEQSVAIMQPQANGERVIVRTSLARGLPAVMADARSIRQVMLNLLSNAIKFTPPGGQAFVSTGVNEAGEVMLRVRDTGIGMSEGDIQTAMEPFRQLAVRSDTRQRGTGLGLPLTRALVEANQGSFVIRSRLNEGTLVEIAFPRSRVLVD